MSNDQKVAADFQDTSEDCAICLNALFSAETITLACGHRWHLDCLSQQLRVAQPSPAQRILFTGCRCAKCGVYCEHEQLANLTRRTDELRKKVNGLILEQIQMDHPPELQDESSKLEYGYQKMAFYLCCSCKEPYFGGTIECDAEHELPPSDRLCVACQPQTTCHSPMDHRGSLVWKCRYCCQPSKYVCYGTMHFCQDCHDRNSELVSRTLSGPPNLNALPCPGESCAFPKPRGCTHHNNGSTAASEQIYHCAACESSLSQFQYHVEAGSRNLIGNHSGQNGFEGWQNGRPRFMQWQIEESEIPASSSSSTNFVSSYYWCVMSVRVPIHKHVRQPSLARIEVSCKYMGRTDCPSVFRMVAIVLDSYDNELYRVETDTLDTAADHWERVSLILEPRVGLHDVIVFFLGKDKNFWQGTFGAKVAECSVRVLCSEEELDAIMLPEQEANDEVPAVAPAGCGVS